jgi:hypothetical protein
MLIKRKLNEELKLITYIILLQKVIIKVNIGEKEQKLFMTTITMEILIQLNLLMIL